jgi:succinate dehydrogenase / fumarate reductase cytochrome b subunit
MIIKNPVGKKLLIAITGQMMAVFVILHLPGNYFNPYSLKLPDIGSFLWIIYFVLLLSFILHTYLSVQSTLENYKARPGPYAVKKSLRTTFAAKTMIWTGLLTGAFIVYHLLQVRFSLVEGSFKEGYLVPAIYIAAFAALFLHLYHGLASFFQTIGWNGERALPVIERIGKCLAFVLLAGYIAVIIYNRIY